MINRKFFFDAVRLSLFSGSISNEQVAGLTAILDTWKETEQEDDRWLAYMLATAYHETARTMQPIDERGSAIYFEGRYGYTTKVGKMLGNTKPGDGALYHGRGYVQLTGRGNYAKAMGQTGVDLIGSPNRAKELDVAAIIMFCGMVQGWFTGKKLADYFTDTKTDWVNARRIINGTDKASAIAVYAQAFHAALSHK